MANAIAQGRGGAGEIKIFNTEGTESRAEGHGGTTLKAAAYEVDDFQAVTVFKRDLGPGLARSDFVVEFDGDPVGLHVQRFDERGQGEGAGIGECAGVAVDVEGHRGGSLVVVAVITVVVVVIMIERGLKFENRAESHLSRRLRRSGVAR
jgi:hypothetical protein